MKSRVFLAALTACTTFAASPLFAADADGFTSIFNGRDLEGWEGNPALWSVRDGTITGQTKAPTDLKHNTFLVWKAGTVDDFELHFRYKIVGGNSGMQYRSKVMEQGPSGPIVGGYQADFEAGKTYSGILYEERGRGILANRGQKTHLSAGPDGKTKIDVVAQLGKSEDIQAAIKQEDWNDYVVIAQGNHVTHSINGHVTADVTDDDAAHAPKSGVLALQIHQGPAMVVQFKDLRLKKLGPVAAADDQAAIQGEWVGISGLRNREAIPQEWVSSLHLKITGEKYDISWTDGGDAGTLKVKSGTQPKQMDITSNGAGTIEGIYKLQDGQLTVSYGMDGSSRPKDFGAAGDSTVTITYKKK